MATSNIQTARNRVESVDPHQRINEAERVLTSLRDLAPGFAARSQEIEDNRRVPADIFARLKKLGLFRTLLPRSIGGLEFTAPEAARIIETLAAADSSIGWVAMIATSSQMFLTRLPLAMLERVYGSDPDTMAVGAGTPVGKAEKIDGGYRISGRWPFSSGCQDAQWIAGHCVVVKDGQPVMTEQGPQTTFVFLPASRWHIEDSWQSSGLAGSGSHHISLDNAEVTDAEVFQLFGGKSAVPGPLEGGIMAFNASFHAAVAVGIATGAIADLVASANSGRRQLFAAADLKDSPVFQHELGKLDAQLRAARALVQVQVEDQWKRAVAGTLNDTTDFAEGLQTSAWVHAACTDVVSGCYTLGGASSILKTSPLQRRLRDIHAARQHGFAHERFYGAAGRNLLGFPPASPLGGH